MRRLRFNPDLIYPVGSIYFSVNNINPSTYFGGTWVSWSSGRVPIGVDSNDKDFSDVEKIGGNKSATLTIENYQNNTWLAAKASHNIFSTLFNAGETYGMNLSQGENEPVMIVQPYITCYMWKRTA